MVRRRSVFNGPSSSSDSDGHGSYLNDSSSQASADLDSESEIQSPSDNEPVEEDPDDDEDEGTDIEPNHWGDQEDTGSSVKPYLGLLAGLERDHNTSLSKHLYSGYLLKRRVPSIPPPTSSDSGSNPESAEPHPKKRRNATEDVPDSEEDDDKYLFGRGRRFITKGWTSWPHPPSFVPRESEHKISRFKSQPSRVYFDPETYSEPLKLPLLPAPSQMLEETLVATFLQISKDRLRSRSVQETGGAEPALDDDVSEHVLKPVVRHVITQLDGLLTGLYHERRYARAPVAKDEKAAAVATGKTKGKEKLRASGTKRLRGKSATTSTTDTDDKDSYEERDLENDDGEGTPPKKKPKSTRRRRHQPAPLAKKYAAKRQNRLRLRDWSQVLGVAALTGWEEDAVQRTVKRCEDTFGQTMSWRRLEEGGHTGKPKPDEMWTGARSIDPMQGEDKDEDGISRDGFLQPISVRVVGEGSNARCLIGTKA